MARCPFTEILSSENLYTALEDSVEFDNGGGDEGRGGAGIIGAAFEVKIGSFMDPAPSFSGDEFNPSGFENTQQFGTTSTTSGTSIGSARPTNMVMEVAYAPDSNAARATNMVMEVALEASVGGARPSSLLNEIAFAPDTFLARPSSYLMEVALLDPTAGNVPFLAPTDGAQGKPLVPLLEIDLEGTTGRYCNVQLGGVMVRRDPNGSSEDIFFEPGVLSFGSINREIDPSGRDFRVTEFQVDLDNSTGVWSQIKSVHGLTGRTVRMKVGDPSDDFDGFGLLYTGTIAPGSTISDTVCRFTVTDVFTSKLDTPVLIPVTEFSFPFLPESTPSGGVVPVAIGNHLAGDGRRLGQLPGFLIDPAFTNPVLGSSFRYAALQGEIEGIEEVYVKGTLMTEGVDYEIVTEHGELPGALFYTSDFITYIDFASDPRAATSTADETPGFEVTFNARGLAEPSSGVTYTNPADVLWTFMKKHTINPTDPFNQVSVTPLDELGLQDDDFDLASISVARIFFADNGIECSFALFDSETTLRTVLDRFAESFGLMVTTNVFGKIQFDVRTKQILSAGAIPHITQNGHIVDNSFSVATQDRVIAGLTVNSDRDWVLGKWYDVGSAFSADNNTRTLGGTETLNLWYVRDDDDRAFLASEFLFFAEENRNLVNLACDPHLYDDIALGDNIAITHNAGPSNDGLGYRRKNDEGARRWLRLLQLRKHPHDPDLHRHRSILDGRRRRRLH